MGDLFPIYLGLAGLGVTIVAQGAAGLIWAIRQEGRVNAHDQLFDEREKRADERHEEILARMDRFERLLNGRK
jgi:2-polyprenyl-6-methoxyphenol hydroxylase-like FAD-dependent oxidoreductase